MGMLLSTTDKFKKIVKEYRIRRHKHLRFKKNDKDKILVVCHGKEYYKWVAYASTTDGSTFQVKTFNDVCNCDLVFYNGISHPLGW